MRDDDPRSIQIASGDDALARRAADPPDPNLVYANYLKTCRRFGVQPVSREHATELIAEWSNVIAAGRSVPPDAPVRRLP